MNTFEMTDYYVVILMVIISCAIGTCVAFFGKKQKTSDDFLLGGSQMKTLPMALSLAASFITAIDLLGNPSEMYKFGTQFWTICIAILLVIPITTKFYLPIFMKLRLTSSFEYLEMRFNRKVRIFASFIYSLQMILYTSVAVYAPAIALSRVTAINVMICVLLIYVVCIFYSSQGGMKAVIITDTFQAAILIISLIVVAWLGQYMIDASLLDTLKIAYKSGRLEFFKFNFTLTERHTLWTQVVGGIAYWLPMFCSNQAAIQKYLSVESIKQVRIALWVCAISLVVIYTMNFYTGMIVFAQYYKNDPLKQTQEKSELNSKDEILPFFVMNILGHFPGLAGLFVAGIFASSFSTVASTLNSLAAITIKDFMDAGFNYKIPDNKGAALSKWISIAFGVISFMLIFLVRQMDSVLKAALTFNGIVGGVNVGLFSLGMLLPWINSKGALFGSVVSLSFISWIAVNSQIAESRGFVAEFDKPVYNVNCTVCPEFQPSPVEANPDVFVLFRISYMWYSAIGLIVTIFVGTLISWITGFNDPSQVDSNLISPPMKRFYSPFSKDTKEKQRLPIETKDEIMGPEKV